LADKERGGGMHYGQGELSNLVLVLITFRA